jgi:uncharacterized protein involved in tolerance to divalent cations
MDENPDLYTWNNAIYQQAEEELMVKLERMPSYEEVMEYMDNRSKIDVKEEKSYNLGQIFDRSSR